MSERDESKAKNFYWDALQRWWVGEPLWSKALLLIIAAGALVWSLWEFNYHVGGHRAGSVDVGWLSIPGLPAPHRLLVQEYNLAVVPAIAGLFLLAHVIPASALYIKSEFLARKTGRTIARISLQFFGISMWAAVAALGHLRIELGVDALVLSAVSIVVWLMPSGMIAEPPWMLECRGYRIAECAGEREAYGECQGSQAGITGGVDSSVAV